MLSRPRLHPRPAAGLAAALLLAVGLAPAVAATPAQGVDLAAAAVTDADLAAGLVVHYPLTSLDGAVVEDASGHDRDATAVGGPTASSEGLALDGVDDHVRLPDHVLAGLTDATVSTEVWIAPEQATPYFVWGLGNTGSNGQGNGYLFTTGNGYRTAIASGNWSTEQSVGAGRDLARGAWKTITWTLSGGTAVLYEDGVEVARRTGVTLTPGAIGAGRTTANYLGRSVYTADRRLQGRLRDFRLYDRALGADEVHALGAVADEERVSRDLAALDLGDTSRVTTDLLLPTVGPNGSTYAWESTEPSVVAPDGSVTRPPHGSGDATVVLTATASYGAASGREEFTVVVPEDLSDAEKVARDRAALQVWDAAAVRGNLTLPTEGAHGSDVAWRSNRDRVVTATGEVTRPAHGERAVEVLLTATVTHGAAKDKRQFRLTVLPLPAPAAAEGYVFSYFTGEGTADGEQVYLAASRGNDPLHWDELNGGQPILRSQAGDRGVRDPFLIRSPEGDKFFMVATDLKINGNGNWDAAQRSGSRHLEVWESTDLVHWSEQRHVLVSPETAGNTWAPEAFWSEELGSYVVFWASKLYAEDDPRHTGGTHNRMLYATTRDFRTFTEPQVWIDPGWSVIDSTVVEHEGTYYRYTKDERNNTSTTPCSKFIVAESSTSLLDLEWDHVAECIGKATATEPGIRQGEGPTVFKSNTEDRWFLFIDEFGGRGYVPFETTDLASGEFRLLDDSEYDLPARPRHGTVLPVTAAELARVRAAYGTP